MSPPAISDQGFSKRISERPEGVSRNRHADGHPAGFLSYRSIEIKLAVPEDALGSPGAILCSPRKCRQRCDRTMIRPIYHIRRCITFPIEHLKSEGIVFVMAGI